jgi:hypothetical protein
MIWNPAVNVEAQDRAEAWSSAAVMVISLLLW